MEHIVSIIWLAAWPVLIFIIYRIILAAVKFKGFLHDGDEDD